MKEINKVLDGNEKVLWEGEPQFLPFVISGSAVSLLVAIFLFILVVPFAGLIMYGKISGYNAFGYSSLLLLPHLWIGAFFLVAAPLYQILSHRHTHYAVTDKRVIIQKGLIGRDFYMVDFDKIGSADVNVGIVDKVFGKNTGSIRIISAGGARALSYTLRNIEDPYTVFKSFKKVSHDVKTDIQYPNAMRPEENKGYDTDYSDK
jgi:uncharacterized membrane protein YdbT with pleckstrin-like domain